MKRASGTSALPRTKATLSRKTSTRCGLRFCIHFAWLLLPAGPVAAQPASPWQRLTAHWGQEKHIDDPERLPREPFLERCRLIVQAIRYFHRECTSLSNPYNDRKRFHDMAKAQHGIIRGRPLTRLRQIKNTTPQAVPVIRAIVLLPTPPEAAPDPPTGGEGVVVEPIPPPPIHSWIGTRSRIVPSAGTTYVLTSGRQPGRQFVVSRALAQGLFEALNVKERPRPTLLVPEETSGDVQRLLATAQALAKAPPSERAALATTLPKQGIEAVLAVAEAANAEGVYGIENAAQLELNLAGARQQAQDAPQTVEAALENVLGEDGDALTADERSLLPYLLSEAGSKPLTLSIPSGTLNGLTFEGVDSKTGSLLFKSAGPSGVTLSVPRQNVLDLSLEGESSSQGPVEAPQANEASP